MFLMWVNVEMESYAKDTSYLIVSQDESSNLRWSHHEDHQE